MIEGFTRLARSGWFSPVAMSAALPNILIYYFGEDLYSVSHAGGKGEMVGFRTE